MKKITSTAAAGLVPRYGRSGWLLVGLVALGLVMAPWWSGLALLLAVGLTAVVGLAGLGIFARLGLAVFVAGVGGALLLQFTGWLGLQPAFGWLHAVLLLLAAAYVWLRREAVDLRSSWGDLAGLGVGLVVFVVLAYPLFGASLPRSLQYMVGNEDYSSQFQMYHYVMAERQYAYGNPIEQAGIRPSLLTYSQGSHAAMAVVTAPFTQGMSPAGLARMFILVSAAAYALVFWLGYVLLARQLPLARRWFWRPLAHIGLAAAYLVALPLGVSLSMFSFGHYAQYFSYLGLVVILLLVLQKPDGAASRRQVAAELVVLALAFYAIFASWYLIAPVALLALSGYVVVRWRLLWRNLAVYSVLLLPVAAACGYLTYVYLFSSFDGANHLLTPGGVAKLSAKSWLVGVPALALLVYAYKRRSWRQAGVAAGLVAASGLVAFIGWYQQHEIEHYEYYFYKCMFTVVLLGVLYYSWSLIDVLRQRDWRWSAVPLAGLLMIGAVMAAGSIPPHLRQFIDQRYVVIDTPANHILDVYTYDKNYRRYSDLIRFDSCERYDNFKSLIWGGSFYLPYNPQRATLEEAVLIGSNGAVLTALQNYAATKDRPVAVVATGHCQLSAELQQAGLEGRNVMLVDEQGRRLPGRD